MYGRLCVVCVWLPYRCWLVFFSAGVILASRPLCVCVPACVFVALCAFIFSVLRLGQRRSENHTHGRDAHVRRGPAPPRSAHLPLTDPLSGLASTKVEAYRFFVLFIFLASLFCFSFFLLCFLSFRFVASHHHVPLSWLLRARFSFVVCVVGVVGVSHRHNEMILFFFVVVCLFFFARNNAESTLAHDRI